MGLRAYLVCMRSCEQIGDWRGLCADASVAQGCAQMVGPGTCKQLGVGLACASARRGTCETVSRPLRNGTQMNTVLSNASGSLSFPSRCVIPCFWRGPDGAPCVPGTAPSCRDHARDPVYGSPTAYSIDMHFTRHADTTNMAKITKHTETRGNPQ